MKKKESSKWNITEIMLSNCHWLWFDKLHTWPEESLGFLKSTLNYESCPC